MQNSKLTLNFLIRLSYICVLTIFHYLLLQSGNLVSTKKLGDLENKFKYELLERASRVNAEKPVYVKPPRPVHTHHHHHHSDSGKTDRQILFIDLLSITDIIMIYDDEGDSIKAYQAAIM